MDKLKQVQKYQFWIILAVALILPLVGWGMAMSSFGPDIESRAKAITDLQGQLNTTPADPNQNWKQGLDIVNVEQGKQKALAWRALWERQERLMTWPEKMPDDPEKITMGQQELWRTRYPKYRDAVRLKVNPYDEEHPKGLVQYSEDLLPAPELEWVTAPSIKQIVASQEDLWLLESILTSIADVNKGVTTIFDSPIRSIDVLYFRGGTSKSGGGSKGGSSGGGGAANDKIGISKDVMKDMMEKNGIGGPSRGGLGNALSGQQGQGKTQINSAQINPDDVLGPERAAATEKSSDKKSSGSDTAGKMTMSLGGPGGEVGGMGGGGMGGGVQTGWSGFDKDRYRDDKKEWKTRGFHLEVVMDHRAVPELLTSLSNGAWPVTVLQVHMSDYKDEDLTGTTSMGGMAGGMGGTPSPAGGGSKGMSSMSMSMSSPGGPGGSSKASGGPIRQPRSSSSEGDEGGAGLDPNAGMNQRSILDDPNLAHVSIVGVFYIVKKPDEDKSIAPANQSPNSGTGGSQQAATNSPPPETNQTEAAGENPPAEETAAATEEETSAAEETPEPSAASSTESQPETPAQPTGEQKPEN